MRSRTPPQANKKFRGKKFLLFTLVVFVHIGALSALTYLGTQAQVLPLDTSIQVALIQQSNPEPPATAPEPNPNPLPDAPPTPAPATPPPVTVLPQPEPPKPVKPIERPPKPVPRPVQERPKAAITETALKETEPVATPVPREESSNANQTARSGGAALPGPLSDTAGGRMTGARYDAAYLNNPKPRYPTISRRMREEGKVMLRVLVTSEGQAGEVELFKSCGFTRLDAAAMESVRRWRFVPAKRAGNPVESWVLIPIVFNLEG